MKTINLQSLINKIDWLTIEPQTGRKLMHLNEIGVIFKRNTKRSEKVDRVVVRFGQEVIEKIQWAKGERIFVYNDPDDQMLFRILKSESRHGWILQKDANTPTYSISFPWPYPSILREMKLKVFKHSIYEGNIFFRVKTSDDAEDVQFV